MNNEPIMIIHAALQAPFPQMTMPDGQVTIIPFTGDAEGPLFKGTILPGGADIQVTNPAGVKHMHAQYMLDGVDHTGEPCKIFVENHGYFEKGGDKMPFEAWPTLRTDSKALRPYLNGMHFRAEGHPWEKGVEIRIFDTEKD